MVAFRTPPASRLGRGWFHPGQGAPCGSQTTGDCRPSRLFAIVLKLQGRNLIRRKTNRQRYRQSGGETPHKMARCQWSVCVQHAGCGSWQQGWGAAECTVRSTVDNVQQTCKPIKDPHRPNRISSLFEETINSDQCSDWRPGDDATMAHAANRGVLLGNGVTEDLSNMKWQILLAIKRESREQSCGDGGSLSRCGSSILVVACACKHPAADTDPESHGREGPRRVVVTQPGSLDFWPKRQARCVSLC